MKDCTKCGMNCHEVGNGQFWYCTDCKIMHVIAGEDVEIRKVTR